MVTGLVSSSPFKVSLLHVCAVAIAFHRVSALLSWFFLGRVALGESVCVGLDESACVVYG